MGKKAWIVAIVLFVAVSWNLIDALQRPVVDLPVARSNAINETAREKGIEFMTKEQAMNDPLYRALIEDDDPVIAPNETYFVGNLPADGNKIVMEAIKTLEVSQRGNGVELIYWRVNHNLAKPF
jgi:hypothetical protein